MPIVHVDQLRLRHRADDGFLRFAVFEQDQGWNAANAVAAGQLRVFINVDLAHIDLVGVLARDFLDHWVDDLTRSARQREPSGLYHSAVTSNRGVPTVSSPPTVADRPLYAGTAHRNLVR